MPQGYWVCPYGVVNCPECKRDDVSREVMAERLASYNRAVPASHRVYLAVPYAEKDAAKGIGARWDANKRLWYCDGREGITRFAKWFRTQKNVAVIEQPAEKAAASTIGYNELLDALAAADREEKDVIIEVDYIEVPKNINYG